MPLHVLSTMCSSTGGQNCIIQHLVSSSSSLNLCAGRLTTGVMIRNVNLELLTKLINSTFVGV